MTLRRPTSANQTEANRDLAERLYDRFNPLTEAPVPDRRQGSEAAPGRPGRRPRQR